MKHNSPAQTGKALWMPDSYVIIFFIVLLAALSTYFVPVGQFEVLYKASDDFGNAIARVSEGESITFDYGDQTYVIDATGDMTLIFVAEDADNQELLASICKSRPRAAEVWEDNAFRFRVIQEYGQYISSGETKGISLFEDGGGLGFLNFAFEGLVKGDKWSPAVGIIAFILIVGGAFGVVLKTGAVESGILKLTSRMKGAEILAIPVLFFVFALGGAVFGMAEETIPFAMIVVPLVIAMGYDAIVGLMIVFVSTQIGFATSWMNPFSVSIAQAIAGVPVMSGAGFRIAMFVVFTSAGAAYTWNYARKIKNNPGTSIAWESDAFYRNDFEKLNPKDIPFNTGHFLVLFTILLGMIWIIWGVNRHGYYIPEIAAIFFAIGLVAGITGVIFGLNNMKINDIAHSFRQGVESLAGTAVLVGMAQGVVLVLGDSSPVTDSVLNTLLYGMTSMLGGLSATFTTLLMFFSQSIINFFIVSGSGQAAITMPLMAPLAQILGVSRQIAVLAFQLGDGLTNIIVPTSAVLMGILGVARLDWLKWARFQARFLSFMFVLAVIFLLIAVSIDFS